MKRDQLSKGRRTAEWKGWNEQMPVQVVTSRGTEVFRNLSEARRKYPTLDPQRNTRDFTWAMRGSVSGRPAIRFEDWATEEIMSRAASLRIQAIKLAYENPGPVRDAILPLLTRTASSKEGTGGQSSNFQSGVKGRIRGPEGSY